MSLKSFHIVLISLSSLLSLVFSGWSVRAWRVSGNGMHLALAIFSFIAAWSEFILPLVLAPSSDVQPLSVYLAGLLTDDYLTDYGLLKAVGLFYILPVMVFYLFAQDKLMNIYRGAQRG